MINNKRKQKKIIIKLELLRNMYTTLLATTYEKEREKYIQQEKERDDNFLELDIFALFDLTVLHSSEGAETFQNKKSKKIEGILKLYNNLNEKLPHHIRLDLLE